MIEYEDYDHRGRREVRVRLDGKLVGLIRLVEGGFAYFPGNKKQHGDVFRTVREVQRSLEGDDDEGPRR